MKKIIAIDVDDVIAASLDTIRRRTNERLKIDLSFKDYEIKHDYWDYLETVWEKHGIKDKAKYEDHENEMIADQSSMTLLPGAALAVKELSKRFSIAIVTARSPAWEAATLRWLKQHFGDVFVSVHFTGHYNHTKSKPKGVQARELGASWLIDDSPNHCQTALDEGVQPILFGEYGWHVDVPEGTVQCKDWQSVLDYFAEVG